MLILCGELHDEILSTSLDIDVREGKTIFSIRQNNYRAAIKNKSHIIRKKKWIIPHARGQR
jgi:hypothetical protein